MGGIGSGRQAGFGRDTTGGLRTLDVNYLHRSGQLRPGAVGTTTWSRGGESFGSAVIKASAGRLTLHYRVRIGGGEWEDVAEDIVIEHIPCRLGGVRPYFRCPGRSCGRRVAKIYGADRYFLCRHCCRLAYDSQRERALDRASRRANKIRERLGGEPGLFAPFPPRPKGMWRRTYERLRREAEAREALVEAVFEGRVAWLDRNEGRAWRDHPWA